MPRPAGAPRSRRTIAGLAVALAAVLGASTARTTASSLDGVVVHVVDGDTIHVRIADRVERVRYIGIDAPEIRHPRRGLEPGGQEAHEMNRRLVAGKHVRLELDVQQRDRHGRLLAYVWVDDVMVNAELVGFGYAHVMTVPPNVRHAALLLTRERDARRSGRGLWRGA
jgi:micrococcal nuclease